MKSDPLLEDSKKAHSAACMLLDDFSLNGEIEPLVEAIRQAALNDSRFNYLIIETIARFAVEGFATVNDQARLTE